MGYNYETNPSIKLNNKAITASIAMISNIAGGMNLSAGWIYPASTSSHDLERYLITLWIKTHTAKRQ